MPNRLHHQTAFAVEADRLKSVVRMISLVGGARRENSAEHSWHLALLVRVLGEYAPDGTDLDRASTMLLVHDLVEIDAGDAFAFDTFAQGDRRAREEAAADRIFGLLPDDQATDFRAIWDEFEEGETPTAGFANAIDRLQALLLNGENGGGTWHLHDVDRTRVLARMAPIERWTPGLWPHVLATLDRVGLGEDAATPDADGPTANGEHAELDITFMRRALALAEEANARGESAVGSVLVRAGEIVAEGIEAARAESDPTAHAELLAIRAACRDAGGFDLSGTTLYTTVEPCLSCAYAIRATGVARVVIGTDAGEIGSVRPGARHRYLTDAGFTGWGPPPSVTSGVLADEARALRK
jgi:putative hydrolase of HD superfamily